MDGKKLKIKALTLILLLNSTSTIAEVSDKAPSVSQIWSAGILGAVIIMLLVRWSQNFVPIVLVVIGMVSYSMHELIFDPFVEKAILVEQGEEYFVSVYGSIGVTILGLLAGSVLNRRKNKSS